MSHVQEGAALKIECRQTGSCAEYETYLQTEHARIDHEARADAFEIGALGAVAALVAVVVYRSGTALNLRRFIASTTAAALLLTPAVLIEGAAFIGGFLVSFSSCFKQTCTAFESTAALWLPTAALLLSVPLTIMLFRKYPTIRDAMTAGSTGAWMRAGVLLLILVLALTSLAVAARFAEAKGQKEYLQRSIESLPR